MPERYDSTTLSASRKDARGFLRLDAAPTKAGIFVYRRSDGSEIRELRPESEVFHRDSLATLEHAPVTALHPTEPVGPANIRALGIGRVIGTPRQDGALVTAALVIEDADSIARVERGEDKELSCGYSCDVQAKPGTWRGQRYDAVQTNIRYNHIALGPAGWGRAGSDVSLRLDSGDAVIVSEIPCGTEGNKMAGKIRLDGVEYEAPETTVAVFERQIEKRDGEIKALQDRADKAEAARDLAVAELEKERDPKVRQDAVSTRVALERSAAKVLGEEKLDSLSDHEIRTKVVTKADTGLDLTGKTETYVEALFDSVVAKAAKRNDGLANTLGAPTPVTLPADPYAARRNAFTARQSGGN